MKNKRGFKHYLKFWGIASFVYLVYVLYMGYTNDSIDPAILFSVLYLPFLFTAFLWLFDMIFDKIFPSKDKKKDDEFTEFLKHSTNMVNEQLDLSIEDFRRLRENEKFQKSLYQAYLINLSGETPEINFVFLEKKFKKDTREYQALMIVINEVKKMIAN